MQSPGAARLPSAGGPGSTRLSAETWVFPMPPKKAASTVKSVVAKDAATFDVEAWLKDLSERGFKPRNVTVKLHLRGDLLPRINSLIEQIQNAGDIDREVGVNDSDPIALLVAEYERLTAEFEAGGHIEFVFRPMTKAAHNDTYTEWVERYPGDDHSSDEWDELAMMRMAATCVDFPGRDVLGPLTVDALKAFESAYGTPAFNTLVAGWSEAYNAGGEVTAPFSPKRSPTPDISGSSNT